MSVIKYKTMQDRWAKGIHWPTISIQKAYGEHRTTHQNPDSASDTPNENIGVVSSTQCHHKNLQLKELTSRELMDRWCWERFSRVVGKRGCTSAPRPSRRPLAWLVALLTIKNGVFWEYPKIMHQENKLLGQVQHTTHFIDCWCFQNSKTKIDLPGMQSKILMIMNKFICPHHIICHLPIDDWQIHCLKCCCLKMNESSQRRNWMLKCCHSDGHSTWLFSFKKNM
jgi:hypothetical protein